MTSTAKTVDTIFRWQTHPAFVASCRLRIYQPLPPLELTVVIVSELPDNEGSSITNDAERLVDLVSKEFSLDLFKTVWLEHYPPDGVVSRHSYSKVFFAGQRAYWKHTTKEEIEALIQCALDES